MLNGRDDSQIGEADTWRAMSSDAKTTIRHVTRDIRRRRIQTPPAFEASERDGDARYILRIRRMRPACRCASSGRISLLCERVMQAIGTFYYRFGPISVITESMATTHACGIVAPIPWALLTDDLPPVFS